MVDLPETDATPGGEAGKTDVHDLVEDYLTARSDEHGSGTYAASAQSELDRWADWMAERGYDLDTLEESGPDVLRRYATRLRRRTQGVGIAASTAQTYFAYVSACVSFAVREGRLGRNPAQTETARELVPEDSRDRNFTVPDPPTIDEIAVRFPSGDKTDTTSWPAREEIGLVVQASNVESVTVTDEILGVLR